MAHDDWNTFHDYAHVQHHRLRSGVRQVPNVVVQQLPFYFSQVVQLTPGDWQHKSENQWLPKGLLMAKSFAVLGYDQLDDSNGHRDVPSLYEIGCRVLTVISGSIIWKGWWLPSNSQRCVVIIVKVLSS